MLPFLKRFTIEDLRFKNILNILCFRFSPNRKQYFVGAILDFCIIIIILFLFRQPVTHYIISPIAATLMPLKPLQETKKGYEVFGFAPHWTFYKLDNIDFNVLTTLAYFGVPVLSDGSLDRQNHGYEVFQSKRATRIFKRAHESGTRVVLTITQMDNETILSFLDSHDAQKNAVSETVAEVKARGIDGVNIDFEYVGDPGDEYRKAFSRFVSSLSQRMHYELPESYVTVSVYASSVKDPKIYDIQELAPAADAIFMMAYDFATTSSSHVIPTSPLYGYKEGKYWYDVSSAVDDFLRVVPAQKLIMGVAWYGYNYAVYEPSVKAEVNPGYYTYYWYRWRQYSQFHSYPSMAQTYSITKNKIDSSNSSIGNVTSGWDEYGRVGWKAYQEDGIWRMVFIEDEKSLGLKYDFAKEKGLRGVGMWALGFDHGTREMWGLLSRKFGTKLADSSVLKREIY